VGVGEGVLDLHLCWRSGADCGCVVRRLGERSIAYSSVKVDWQKQLYVDVVGICHGQGLGSEAAVRWWGRAHMRKQHRIP